MWVAVVSLPAFLGDVKDELGITLEVIESSCYVISIVTFKNKLIEENHAYQRRVDLNPPESFNKGIVQQCRALSSES